MMANHVERKIFFYRVRTENPNDSSDRSSSLDAQSACTQIARLQFKGNGRYHFFPDGDSVAVMPKVGAGRPRMTLFRTRRSGFPEFEHAGTFEPIPVEDGQQGRGIAEKTHIVFFDSGIVGAEFNFYGPRIKGLTHYLQAKLHERLIHHFDAIVNRDLVAQLGRMGEISVVQLQIRRDYLHLLETMPSGPVGALRAMSEDMNAPVIEMVLRGEPRSRKGLGAAAMQFVRSISGLSDVREGLNTFKVKAIDKETDKSRIFDLLEDHFVSAVRVAKASNKHKVIDSDDMFEKIETAYESLRDQLETAQSIAS